MASIEALRTHPPGQRTSELRLMVAGEIRLYRDGLAAILHGLDGLEVVCTTSDRATTELALVAHDPHALLVDMAMPESLTIVRSARARGTPVVALALPEVESTFLTCAEAGIAEYVPREATPEDLARAIRNACVGEANVTPRLAGSLMRRIFTLSDQLGSPENEFQLTPREGEIARLLAEGRTNKGIAAELHIGLATVKNHVHNLLRKMGAERRSEVAARLSRARLAELPPLRARRRMEHLGSVKEG